MGFYYIDIDKIRDLIDKQIALISEIESGRAKIKDLVNNRLNESVYSGDDADLYRENMNYLLDVRLQDEINKLTAEKNIFESLHEAYCNCKKYCTEFGDAFGVYSYNGMGLTYEGKVWCDTDLVLEIGSSCDTIEDSHQGIKGLVHKAWNVVRILDKKCFEIDEAINEYVNTCTVRVESITTHKEQIYEYAKMVVQTDDWLKGLLIDCLPEDVLQANNAKFTQPPVIEQYIYLSLKDVLTEDEMVLQERLHAEIMESENGLNIEGILQDVLNKDITEYTDEDYAIMATSYAYGVNRNNTDILNNIHYRIEEISVNNHIKCDEMWYIFNSPANKITDYIDPKLDGEAYYSLNMFLNAERSFSEDKYITRETGILAYYDGEHLYLADTNAIDPLNVVEAHYIGRFTDMNEYITDEVIENLGKYNYTYEDIVDLFASIGSDKDIQGVIELSRLTPDINRNDWADGMWQKIIDEDSTGEITHAFGKAVANYNYHIAFNEKGELTTNGNKYLTDFTNGLYRVEHTVGETPSDVFIVSPIADGRYQVFKDIQNGSLELLEGSMEEFANSTQIYNNYEFKNENRARQLLTGFYASNADFLAQQEKCWMFKFDGHGYIPASINPNLVTSNCNVCNLAIVGEQMTYRVSYDVDTSRFIQYHDIDSEYVKVTVQANSRPVTDNILDDARSAKEQATIDAQPANIVGNCISIAAETAAGYIPGSNEANGAANLMIYFDGLDNVKTDAEIDEDAFKLYTGAGCSYSIEGKADGSMVTHGQGYIYNRYAFYTNCSFKSLYAMDQMAGGVGVASVIPDEKAYNAGAEDGDISFDSMLNEKITSTCGEEHDYYVDNQKNLGQIHDGGFDAPAYIYEYGLPAYYDLIDSYNDLTPGQDYYYGEYLVEEGRNYYAGNGE